MRVGILGGTFDPIHLGHLIIAEEVRVRMELTEVVCIPTGQPWMRVRGALSAGEDRLAMVKLAIAANHYFRAADMELTRLGVTYTVDTLETLHRELGREVELFFILGLDSLVQFPLWREPARVLELCTLVAVARPGHAPIVPASLEAIASGASSRVVFLEGPQIGISGTEIRQRVRQGISIRYWVPQQVEEYIKKNRLYLDQEEESG